MEDGMEDGDEMGKQIAFVFSFCGLFSVQFCESQSCFLFYRYFPAIWILNSGMGLVFS